MTTQEFSDSFDILLNSFANRAEFGGQDSLRDISLNEYEKSVFLTKAQEELLLSLYNGRNSSLQSFEETEELRRFLSKLVKEALLNPITTTDGKPLGIESNSKFFTLPDTLWFITYEAVKVSSDKCGNENSMEVFPVTQDEYHKIRKNPFRGANDRRALRLDLSDGVIEIVCKYTVTSYYLRYLRKPNPIILADMPDGLTIDGKGSETPCELHTALHQKILDRAVMLALQSNGYKISDK